MVIILSPGDFSALVVFIKIIVWWRIIRLVNLNQGLNGITIYFIHTRGRLKLSFDLVLKSLWKFCDFGTKGLQEQEPCVYYKCFLFSLNSVLVCMLQVPYAFSPGCHSDHNGHCAWWVWLHAGIWWPCLGSIPVLPAASLPAGEQIWLALVLPGPHRSSER